MLHIATILLIWKCSRYNIFVRYTLSSVSLRLYTIPSFIVYIWALYFMLNHILFDDCGNICAFYYHHQFENMNDLPLFSVGSWMILNLFSQCFFTRGETSIAIYSMPNRLHCISLHVEYTHDIRQHIRNKTKFDRQCLFSVNQRQSLTPFHKLTLACAYAIISLINEV